MFNLNHGDRYILRGRKIWISTAQVAHKMLVLARTATAIARPTEGLSLFYTDLDGRVLTLVEDFAFGDGTKERKTWRMTKTAEGVYRGTREDVIGEADVRQDGDGVRLDYRVTLATALGPIAVRFQDLLTLNAEGVVVNKAVVTKFGLQIGRVELLMRRAGQDDVTPQK